MNEKKNRMSLSEAFRSNGKAAKTPAGNKVMAGNKPSPAVASSASVRGRRAHSKIKLSPKTPHEVAVTEAYWRKVAERTQKMAARF